MALAALFCGFLGGKRRRLPAILMVMLALTLTFNMGCSANNFVTTTSLAGNGTPLGTTLLTISTVGTNGTNSVRHNYVYQVTVQ